MAEYRIDDLAHEAGMTVRNVRSYQERGLLPPPHRRGRAAVYDDAHLARLRLIGRLLERGYTAAHIADFVAAWQSGQDLGQVLGLETALLAPASGEIPAYLVGEELVATFGGPDEDTAANIARACELGLIVADGDLYRVPNPRLLRAGAELVAIGLSVREVLDVAERLQARVREVAEYLVSVVAGHVVGSHVPGWLPTDEEMPALVTLVERLRPLARVAVDTELAAALDTAIAQFVGRWSSSVLERLDHRNAG